MGDWRWRGGWTEAQLESLLAEARTLPVNFRARPEQMDLAHGWSHVRSDAVVGRAEPGPPRPGGAFARARELVADFEFSDPRIVVGHFSAADPLRGRRLVLELKAFGLHFLGPVVVADVRDESDEEASVFGFCFETLAGHIERGREWFRLTKDHASGEVHFQVEAFWEPGDFPGWWARAGFAAFGRRFQRAWHRLSHVRLRQLIAAGEVPVLPTAGLAHEGRPITAEPIRFYSRRGAGAARAGAVREDEEAAGLLARGRGTI